MPEHNIYLYFNFLDDYRWKDNQQLNCSLKLVFRLLKESKSDFNLWHNKEL